MQQPGGLPPITFVSEYLGEMHTPARWFEIQVSLSVSCSMMKSLPKECMPQQVRQQCDCSGTVSTAPASMHGRQHLSST